MCQLLRSTGKRNHRNKKDLLSLLEGDTAPQANKNSGASWPEFRGPSVVNTRNLGKEVQITAFTTSKYSGSGYVSYDDMVLRGVPALYAETFAKAFNGSKAMNTWKQRKSVLNLIKKCKVESGYTLTMPWDNHSLQIFVGWCMEGGLRANTINQYVSNIRTLHRDLNMTMNENCWQFLSQVIKGHGNLQQKLPGRIPITPDLMFHLKVGLSKSTLTKVDRRLVWLICCCLFQGAYRVGEILAPSKTKFDRETTLLGQDVRFTSCNVEGKVVDLLIFNIKKPKETRGARNVEVEMFDLGPSCFYSSAVAWKKWRQDSKRAIEMDKPVFRREDGSCFTANDLNGILKAFLQDKVQYMKGYVASHSFRSGLVSVMARLGCSEEEICRQGRWQSTSFKAYCKLGRATRLKEQWILASKISDIVTDAVQSGRTIA